MNKQYLQTVILSISLLAASCELINVRDVSSDNLDTLRLDQSQSKSAQEDDQQLADIRKYLGKRPSEIHLWDTEPLNSHLRRILGSEHSAFIELMKNANPLREDKLIYTMGSHPDLSRIGFGYLIIDPDHNLIRAGMVKPGKHYVYGAKAGELETPQEIDRKCKSIL